MSDQFAMHAMMISWFQGNFAGRNATTEPEVAIPTSAKLEQVLDLYCETDPTNTLHEIALEFWPILAKSDRDARLRK